MVRPRRLARGGRSAPATHGRLVFLTHSVTIALCVPDEGGVAGDRLLRAQRDVARVAWEGGGIEHHPSHGDWIRLLRSNGFEIDALREITPPADADTPAFYEIVSGDWATRWPAEDAWLAHQQASQVTHAAR